MHLYDATKGSEEGRSSRCNQVYVAVKAAEDEMNFYRMDMRLISVGQ